MGGKGDEKREGRERGEGKSPRVGAQQGRASERGKGRERSEREEGREDGAVIYPKCTYTLIEKPGDVSRLILTYQQGHWRRGKAKETG